MLENLNTEQKKSIAKALNTSIWVLSFWVISLVFFVGATVYLSNLKPERKEITSAKIEETKPEPLRETFWTPPTESTLQGDQKELVLYGKEIIANTALYFGPKGKIDANSTNGMNCQNCHLEAGTKVFGNNYSSVASTYPKYRARSGKEEDIYKRVNDCFERSLNGKPLKTESKEMQAVAAYINWLGKDVPKGAKAEGAGFKNLEFMDRAADPLKGKVMYVEKCQVCHGNDGQGQLNPATAAFIYPPLWGNNSYNDGAGLYRISNFAKYIKYNMPLGASHHNPQLSDEESWDIAAFVNSMERPKKDISKDWPKIAEKPIDHPFGPFSDGFSETQHKVGPFKPIAEARKKANAEKKTKSPNI